MYNIFQDVSTISRMDYLILFFINVCFVQPLVVFGRGFEVNRRQRRKLYQIVGVAGEVVDALGGFFLG